MTWVIIPAYNEQKYISNVIKDVKKYSKNIIVVDDGSSDETFKIAKKSGVVALKHVVNLGKGAALKTGCDYALKHGAERLIAVDADGQHDPKDIPIFVKRLKNVDIVFGIRKLNKKMPIVLKFGNWFLSWVTKLLYNIDIKDTQCGYRAFTSKTYKKIRWRASDYSMESEIIANVGKNGLKYDFVQIDTIYSDKYKGTTVADGVRIAFNLLVWKLRRQK
ncbi:glycosyltransferase family 2 protein [Candidatus Woesearchaeota archaeon]|nr:glycosyltransferase family 2 protein [Candidatus Woesearchaeota archaeon]